MKNQKTLQIANLLGFVGIIVMNMLAVLLPINGKSTGELSDAYPNLFVPAGFTFSIWSIIFILLGVYAVKQLKGFSDGKAGDYVREIGWLFVVNALANMSWIVAWHYELPVVALGIMLVILGSLVLIYKRLHIGLPTRPNEKLTIQVPFQVYLGWISIATIANVTTVLVDMNWGGFGISEAYWAIIMMVIGFLLAAHMIYWYSDYAFGAVVIWAYFGIYSKRMAAEPLYEDVAYTALGLMALLILSIASRWWGNRSH